MGQTEAEQILLNLVRLRYGDSPYFLEASALNTQFLLAPAAELGATFDLDGTTNYAAKAKLAYEEKPTVTYTPLKGEAFVRQILSRISLDTVLLLDSSGWSRERVLRLCVEGLNGLDNAASASGPTPKQSPKTKLFDRTLKLMSELEQEQAISIFKQPTKSEGYGYHLTLHESDSDIRKKVSELKELLGISKKRSNFKLVGSDSVKSTKTIQFQTRSFMGVMYFLSHSVLIPEVDYESGKVGVTFNEKGTKFDWKKITSPLMTIHHANEKPSNASLYVQYRDKWFYVLDNDFKSKSTLQLLGQLYALQSRNKIDGAPILTLPIGG